MKKLFYFFLLPLLFSCGNKSLEKEGTLQTPEQLLKEEEKSNDRHQSAEPFAVVELFSSEGCSDCPSAEEVLNKITKNAMADKSYIYPLAFHVDYWNKLGWKDIFSDSSYSNRQRKYRKAFGSEVVYTPQMIVNGETEFTGSDEKKADSAISAMLKKTPEVYFSIHPDDNWTKLDFECYSVPKDFEAKKMKLVFCVAIVERNLESKINRGENKGLTLHHQNVVCKFISKELIELHGTIQLPKLEKPLSKNFSIIAFVQNTETMKILGANLWNY